MGHADYDRLNQTLGELLRRVQAPEKPLKEVGLLMVGEMKENIIQGGRPNLWPISIRAEKQGGQTLRDSGTLMNSIDFGLDSNTVAAGPTAVGREKKSDPRIFAALAFGATIRARNKPYLRFRIPGGGFVQKKEVTLAGRDYTYMPPETPATFGEVFRNYVFGPIS